MSNTLNPDLPDLNSPSVPELQALTPPDPIVLENTEKHYFCTVPNASMFKKDGTRLSFINGFFSTKLKSAKDYLDKEVADGHSYIRNATDEEVARILATRDPMAALEADFKTNKEPELRKNLEKDIIATIMGVPRDSVTDEVVEGFISKTAAVTKPTSEPEEIKKRLSVLDSLGSGKGNTVLRSAGGDFIPTASVPSPLASGMVGTDKINDAAGSPGSGSEGSNI
jgi:hypothetical protein